MNRLIALCVALMCVCFALPGRGLASDVDAVRAAEQGQWQRAQRMANARYVRDAVQWMYLVDGRTRASFSQIAGFVRNHADWPAVDKLYTVAEGRLPDNLSNAQVAGWFGAHKPSTGAGMLRYMRALVGLGRVGQGVGVLKNWWPKADLSSQDQKDILSNYGRYLGSADHVRRLQYLLGAKQYTVARALAAHLGGGYPALVNARQALGGASKGVDATLSRLPSAFARDEGLMLARVQYRRRNDLDRGAIALLNAAPPARSTGEPDAWWKERHIMTRRMIEKHDYHTAYKLASHHGLAPGGASFAAAEFVSGWLALRFLHQPYVAFNHFEQIYNNSVTPITRSRAAYWAGRAAEAMQSTNIAMQWYQVAAKYQTTFYGQQAAQHIGLPLNLIKGGRPAVSVPQKNAFYADEMVRVATLFHRAGMQKERTDFLKALLARAASPQDFVLLSDFAISMGQIDMALKVAKGASKVNLYLVDYAFPTMMRTVGNYGVDKALVHAFIRQESQFDINARSPSGALGLMQIMPATGRHTAKRNGLRHSTSWLTSKPTHNVHIGSLYIQELLSKYDGSLPLAIAAYNAGPGRVDRWIKEFGDPRNPRVDTIDWMESIPIYETRNYVQRVMEGYVVYRMKLSRYQGTPQRAENAFKRVYASTYRQ